MGRIRTVKPSFFTSEDVSEVSIPARLLFIGLWTEADKRGRLENRPKQIRARLFPHDVINVVPLLVELEDAGLIQVYGTEDSPRAYIAIPTWEKHQRPHPKEQAGVLPDPPPWKKPARRIQAGSIPSSPGGREGDLGEGVSGREGVSGSVVAMPAVADTHRSRYVSGYPSRPRRSPRCGKHINADVLCEAGMCFPEDLAYQFARKLPVAFDEALQQVVEWAESLVPEWHERVKPDGDDYAFWRNRWSEQFGGSAPSFAQLRARKAAEAFDEAFDG